jgi:hypothetical protein
VRYDCGAELKFLPRYGMKNNEVTCEHANIWLTADVVGLKYFVPWRCSLQTDDKGNCVGIKLSILREFFHKLAVTCDVKQTQKVQGLTGNSTLILMEVIKL